MMKVNLMVTLAHKGGAIVRDLKTVISLLKQYGAKSLSDMKAESVSRWLVLFASYPTGLLTFDGHIDIDALPDVSKALVRDFKAWKAEFWDSWPDRDWAAMPKGFIVQNTICGVANWEKTYDHLFQWKSRLSM